MLLQRFLSSIGMTIKEQDIYNSVVSLGKTTASTVSAKLERERTSTLKLMQGMASKGWLISTAEHHTTYFLPTSLETIKGEFETSFSNMQLLQSQYNLIEQEYQLLQGTKTSDTTVRIYEWPTGLQEIYNLILGIIKTGHLVQVTCFASSTFTSLSGADKKLVNLYESFLKNLKTSWIGVVSYLWAWLNLMEHLRIGTSFDAISQMPQANDATQLRLVGKDIFMLIFNKHIQIIQITSQEMADLFHFIGDSLHKVHKS